MPRCETDPLSLDFQEGGAVSTGPSDGLTHSSGKTYYDFTLHFVDGCECKEEDDTGLRKLSHDCPSILGKPYDHHDRMSKLEPGLLR